MKEYVKKVTNIGNTVEIMLNQQYPGVPVTKWVKVPEEVEVTVQGEDGATRTEMQIQDVPYPVMVWTKDEEQSWVKFKQMVISELQNFFNAIASDPTPEDITKEFQA